MCIRDRKTLQNGLSNAQDLSFSKEEIAAAIESLGLSPVSYTHLFLATCVSTLAGVAVCRVMCRRKQYKSIKKGSWK